MGRWLGLLTVVAMAGQGLQAGTITTDWASSDMAVFSHGNVSIGWRALVEGSVAARGDVWLEGEGRVAGEVYAGDAIQTGWKSSFGTLHAPLGAGPFDAAPLPKVPTTPSGGQAATAGMKSTLALEPGTYGAVAADWRGQLQLGAGTYYFDSLVLGDDASMALDTSQGDVFVFVTGDMGMAWRARVVRSGDGGALFAVGGAFASTSEGVLDSSLLTGGAVSLGWRSQVVGQVFAQGDVTLASESTVGGAPLAQVPEPAATGVLLAGLIGLALRRGRAV